MCSYVPQLTVVLRTCVYTIQLGPNVYVGARVNIGPGARVKEAIVLDRAEILVRMWCVQCTVYNVYIQACSQGSAQDLLSGSKALNGGSGGYLC